MEKPNLKEKRCSIKINDSENQKKHVVWDAKKLKEQELENKLHPKTKITEPKTPYAGNVNFIFKF